MTDERRKAAEKWALEQWGWMDEEDAPIRKALADGYLAGQEVGEKREREEAAGWIRAQCDIWRDEHDKANFRGLADAIERGEHREDSK